MNDNSPLSWVKRPIEDGVHNFLMNDNNLIHLSNLCGLFLLKRKKNRMLFYACKNLLQLVKEAGNFWFKTITNFFTDVLDLYIPKLFSNSLLQIQQIESKLKLVLIFSHSIFLQLLIKSHTIFLIHLE